MCKCICLSGSGFILPVNLQGAAGNDQSMTDISLRWTCNEWLRRASLEPFCVKSDLQLPQIHSPPNQLPSAYFPSQV